jgi:raffinose/stachyose/melibiose transport system permease protein
VSLVFVRERPGQRLHLRGSLLGRHRPGEERLGGVLVTLGLLWRQFYLPAESGGLVASVLASSGLAAPRGGFLGDGAVGALVALIATISWRYVGFHMVLFMAGIETIPEELYEAARIDGAGAWQAFRHVTLPSITHVVRISAVLSIVGSLKYFDLVYVMTRGDGPHPHATDLVTTYMYKTAFLEARYGYGSAVAVAGFVISMVVVLLIFAFRRREAGEVAR